MGKPYAEVDARTYAELKDELRPIVRDALADLRSRYDVVICEGAGSPAEINLRAGDLVNMGLARDAGLPVLIVADIDRGGVFGSLFGTLALLSREDQRHVVGYLLNKFRGDGAILKPGLDDLRERTGRPTLGVLPYLEDLWLDVEDSLALDHRGEAPTSGDTLEVAVVRLRWISNFTDADALASEPGVRVRFTRSAAVILRADLVVIPGTKATVEDLALLRRDGLDKALLKRAAAGDPILGICGGYQLLGETIEDHVESKHGTVRGLGVLPITTIFQPDKLLERHADGSYEIRHGRVERHGGEPLIDGEGCVQGAVQGTSRHGLLENDRFRREQLACVARSRGNRSFIPGTVPFQEVREARHEALADLIEQHTDTASLARLIEQGIPTDMPTLTCSVS